MKLFASTTSPYARKVRIVMLERRLGDAIDIIWASPFADTESSRDLRQVNPLNKIPALVLQSGQAVFDSRVICELLDTLGDGPNLLPSKGGDRVRAQVGMALADGIIDAAFSLTMEGRRPDAQQSSEWIDRWCATISAALSAIAWDDHDGWGLPEIGLVCALDYLTFRLPHLHLITDAAARWRDRTADRPSVSVTFPHD